MAPIKKINLFEVEQVVESSPNKDVEKELREELDQHIRTELLYNNVFCRDERY